MVKITLMKSLSEKIQEILDLHELILETRNKALRELIEANKSYVNENPVGGGYCVNQMLVDVVNKKTTFMDEYKNLGALKFFEKNKEIFPGGIHSYSNLGRNLKEEIEILDQAIKELYW